jgi:hypothetical protein
MVLLVRREKLLLTRPPKPPALLDGSPLDTSRYTKRSIMEAYERIGGVDRLTEEADKDPKWFLEKLWSKTMQPEKIEVSREKSIGEIIAELDAQMIDVTPREVAFDTEFEEKD